VRLSRETIQEQSFLNNLSTSPPAPLGNGHRNAGQVTQVCEPPNDRKCSKHILLKESLKSYLLSPFTHETLPFLRHYGTGRIPKMISSTSRITCALFSSAVLRSLVIRSLWWLNTSTISRWSSNGGTGTNVCSSSV
jgi:hypothetical protein